MALGQSYSRRKVLRWGGAAASVMVAGAVLPNFGLSSALAADLGEGDVAILNYAYALEQLEAAFYTKVTDKPFQSITQQEASTFAEILGHEVLHREFLKKALGEHAISDIEVDFSKVNFDNRASVLDTADAFENLGVAAYNGAGPLIKNVDYLAAPLCHDRRAAARSFRSLRRRGSHQRRPRRGDAAKGRAGGGQAVHQDAADLHFALLRRDQ